VVLKRLKKFLKRSNEPQKPPEVEVKRQHSLQDDYDQAMMAISFAEAAELAFRRTVEFLHASLG